MDQVSSEVSAGAIQAQMERLTMEIARATGARALFEPAPTAAAGPAGARFVREPDLTPLGLGMDWPRFLREQAEIVQDAQRARAVPAP